MEVSKIRIRWFKSEGNLAEAKDLKPASFANGIQRDLPVRFIVDMISRHIKENKQIGIEEIVDCWIDVKLHRNVSGVYLGYYEDLTYKGKWMLRDEMKVRCPNTIKGRAIAWFMNNLGAAIIKGKLLVIPIIDLELTSPPKTTES